MCALCKGDYRQLMHKKSCADRSDSFSLGVEGVFEFRGAGEGADGGSRGDPSCHKSSQRSTYRSAAREPGSERCSSFLDSKTC